MRFYLSDISKDLHLKEFGYALIDFFSEEDVAYIVKLNKSCTKNYPSFGLDFSFFNAGLHKVQAAESAFRLKYEQKIAKHFIKFNLLGIGFINKGIGLRNEVPLHQDWNMVDESEHQSVACWIPLSVIDKHSGSMVIIPKSHHLNTGIRTINHPTQTISVFDKRINKNILNIDLKPGQGIVYFPSLFHGTYPNNKVWIRRTIVLNLIPQEAAPSFYYKNEQADSFGMFLLPADFSVAYKKYILNDGYKNFTKTKDTFIHNTINTTDELIEKIQHLD